ncbi:class I SAM-dependent methyltransferase [Antarcticibacterium flavum]|uniref:class I SAM-dependent methyltransferase n=1 Tax=Antarcticibacterium flavum TaxID=2058175 RepID=UPI001FE82439|nr:class I SAM-dependent methyltransferase [Antarcticibacterium flavum]
MKDNFSHSPKDYSQYRPKYPQELIEYLIQLVNNTGKLWDCGTGNGQLAAALAPYFERVEATDISRQQIAEAKQKENINYTAVPAERTNFPGSFFNLVTVAQAVHWFEFQDFYREVKRVLKPGE